MTKSAIHLDLWNFYAKDGKTYIRLRSEQPGDEPGQIGLTPELLADFVRDIAFYANEPTCHPSRARNQSGLNPAH
jgi:hypothetical protein